MDVHAVTESGEVEEMLRSAGRRRWSYGEVFTERTRRTAARLADSAVIDLMTSSDQGFCLRHRTQHDTGWVAAPTLRPAAIRAAVRGELDMADVLARAASGDVRSGSAGDDGHELDGLLDLLRQVDAAARDSDPRVRQVLIDAELTGRQTSVITTTGEAVHQSQELLYLTIRVVAQSGSSTSTGFYTPGTSRPAELGDPERIGREAADRAVAALDARPAPVERLPVVIGPGRGMVLIHEACCHPLEGDEVLRGSVYAGRVGQAVASPLVTIVDDPTTPGGVGSYGHDDEGVPGRPSAVVQDGQLTGFLTDRDSADRLGTGTTGNGRRSSWRVPALPRMSNTCIAPGTMSPEDVIADTPFGLYAQHVAGGEVVESTGDFVFRVTNGNLIRNGRLAEPIQETTLSGNGMQVLRDIDAVGNDVHLGAARCGKFDQLIPVGVSGPTLRVRELLVGGERT